MKEGNSKAEPPFSSNDSPMSGEESKVPLNSNSSPLPALIGGDLVLEPIGDMGSVNAEERNLTEHHSAHFREDPVRFMMQMGAFYQGTGWRSYRNYIGTRIFYEGYTEELKERVLNSERVLYMIAYLAEKQVNLLSQTLPNANPKMIAKRKKKLEKELQIVANGMVDKLIADLNSIRFLRIFVYFVNNILLRRVAIHAAQNSQSLIILPCHKSHVDYIVISYIFYRLGLALPHITAGDNLDMPIVGTLFKRSGAFFIRRSWGEDQLYGSIVKEYLECLLESGHNVECFIEGTRSRTGKLLPPKLGILKIVLECILSGRTKDCWIVPVSLQYDKVIETETYVHELLGNPKEKETLWSVVTNSRLVQLKWGRIDVRFAKPYSLLSFIEDQKKRRLYLDPMSETQKITLLRALGYQVLSDINSVSVVMPTALVGTVILTLRGRGVGRNELIRRVDWLKAAILAKGGRVKDFCGMSTAEIVDRAMAVLKDLIKERKDLLEPVFYAEKRFELSFYRNQVMHLFVSEAMISVAMYTKIKQGGAKPAQRLDMDTLLKEVEFLSQLLKGEFVYNPGEIKNNLYKTLLGLKNDNVIDYDDKYVELSDAERAIGRENYDFYCFLIWPFIETYWLAAISLFSLTPNNPPQPTTPVVNKTTNDQPAPITWFNERDFQNKSQLFGKTLYYQGDISYFEAVNKETLKNAFILLEDAGVIMVKRSRNVKIQSTIALAPGFVPTRNSDGIIEAKGELWNLVEKIGKFRREGKNRRDNATVSSRVLKLAEMVGTPTAADLDVMNLMNKPSKAGKLEAKL
ncbi:acyltransferase-domain-containing protein [Gigaspora rosea]|uniref:Acyltransferase-domain-containing protein n=1 Tax=Gigaspora rosea TaxID=44941 RepID=A0A397U1Y5_9GLOM|nr:acyltransferase-domain-containing protein [Gigaspora rosea]